MKRIFLERFLYILLDFKYGKVDASSDIYYEDQMEERVSKI